MSSGPDPVLNYYSTAGHRITISGPSGLLSVGVLMDRASLSPTRAQSDLGVAWSLEFSTRAGLEYFI